MRRVESLDGLRAFAVLMVMYAHVPHIAGAGYFNKLPYSFRFGYLGVDIFFVLSGFLITSILISEKKKGIFSFRVFYLKRALRIFPIYYLLIIILGISWSWNGMLPNALYVSNYYFAYNHNLHPLRHTWSLSVEEHFYLVWPVVLHYFSLKNAEVIIKYILPAVAIISAVVTVLIVEPKLASDLIYRGTQYRMLSLSTGAFLAFRPNLIKTIKPLNCIFAAAVIFFIYRKVESIEKPLFNLLLLTPVSTLIFIFAFRANDYTNWLKKIFVNPVISYTGKISYGLYLYHFPVLFFFGLTPNQIHREPIPWQTMLLPVFLTFLIAALSFGLIEKNFLRMKTKLH